MRSIKILILSLVALFASAAIASATPYEVQDWQTQDRHAHLSADLPMLETLSSPRTVTFTVLLHNQPAATHVAWLELQDQGTSMVKIPLNVYGNGQSEQKFTVDVPLDPAKFAHSGWQEMRTRLNIDKPVRTFTTGRVAVNVQNGKSVSNYSGGPTVAGRCGGGAWYGDIPGNYRIIFVDCRDHYAANTRPLVPGDKIRVKSQDGELYANIDPHFHAGDVGIPLITGGKPNTWTTLTIPAGLAPGVHKLHFRSQTGIEAGAYVMTFTTA